MIAFNTSVGESQPGTRPAPAHMRCALLSICRSSLARFKPPDGSIIARSLVWTDGKWDTTEPSPLAAIHKGLSWEFGADEMRVSLVDESAGVVARSIDSHEGAFSIDRELYAYQPARCIVALLSNPRWAAEVPS